MKIDEILEDVLTIQHHETRRYPCPPDMSLDDAMTSVGFFNKARGDVVTEADFKANEMIVNCFTIY